MRFVAAVSAPFLLILAGCLSAPIPQELVHVDPMPTPEPLRLQEITRLENAGISDEVIVGLIRTRGVSDRPGVHKIFIYRELFIPLWPAYSRGRWHLGLRIGCSYRTAEKEVREILPPEPEKFVPQPRFIDP